MVRHDTVGPNPLQQICTSVEVTMKRASNAIAFAVLVVLRFGSFSSFTAPLK